MALIPVACYYGGCAILGPLEGTDGVIANLMCFGRGTVWVLSLTSNSYHPKRARVYLFPQSVKHHYCCSGPISVDPICLQPTSLVLLNIRSPAVPRAYLQDCPLAPFSKERASDTRHCLHKRRDSVTHGHERALREHNSGVITCLRLLVYYICSSNMANTVAI